MENREVFKKSGEFLILDIPYCEFYIPVYYFSKKELAEEMGEKLSVFGVFNVGLFKDDKLVEMKTMNLPTKIEIFVYDTEFRDVKLKNGVETECKVYKYLKGNKIMYSAIFYDDEYAKDYLNFILGGNVPKIVPYSKMLDMWLKNQELNKANYGVSSTYEELIIATYNRNPNRLSEKFSTIAGDPGVSDYDYATASVRQICQYNSTFTALTFEDFDSMVTSSLNRTRNRIAEKPSPVEKIIKM